MSRTIRPIGPVTATLRKAGYRQYAAIFVDGKQVPNVAILSLKVGGKLKFVGHFIDGNGEVSKTTPMADMKQAASHIMAVVEATVKPAVEPKAKPAAKQDAKANRAARRQQHSAKPTPQSIGAMIECRGCGTRHSDDTMCPE